MLIHLEVDPKKCSYQFLYEVALFNQDPDILTEIFNTLEECELKPSYCFDTANEEPYGVLVALAKNQNTSHDILAQIAKSDDECLRSAVMEYCRFDDIIESLLDDEYTIVLHSALKNPNLKRKHFKKLFNRLTNHDIDFDKPENHDNTTIVRFANKLSKHKLATMTEVVSLGKWLAKNS